MIATQDAVSTFQRPRFKRGIIVLAVLAGLSGAFIAGRAVADGIPGTEPLNYAGTLLGASGTPLTGDHAILLRLWSELEAGNVLCTRPEAVVTLELGRFSLPLPDACADSVKNNPDVWVEVVVDSVSLGRAKIGAVPYAIEADHATRATNVAVSTNGEGQRICTGSTVPGETAWAVYSTDYLMVEVDTSACGFSATPKYFTSLGGATHHWTAVGATSIYSATATSFGVYLNNVKTPASANADQWHIQWMAVGN